MTGLAARAGTWGIVMGISPLLRIRHVIERGSSADVSIGYPSVLIVAFAVWATYGLSIANAALVASNCVSAAVGLTTIQVARRYRRTAD